MCSQKVLGIYKYHLTNIGSKEYVLHVQQQEEDDDEDEEEEVEEMEEDGEEKESAAPVTGEGLFDILITVHYAWLVATSLMEDVLASL